MRSELDSLGALAALVLIGIALVHAVVPFPAEFPTAAAGFVFGFAIAFPLMVLAWTMSCLAAYLLARGVGPPVLDRLVGRERMEAADRLIARGGWQILVAGPADPGRPVQRRLLRGGRDPRPDRALHVDDRGRRDAADGADRAARRAPAGAALRRPGAVGSSCSACSALLALARPVGRRLRASQP